jgi:hypothetical protein
MGDSVYQKITWQRINPECMKQNLNTKHQIIQSITASELNRHFAMKKEKLQKLHEKMFTIFRHQGNTKLF